MKTEKKYPINYLSQKTGVTKLLIRAWENRYNLLEPERTESNRRLYSESDVEKVSKIKKAIDLGFKIGFLSELSEKELNGILDNPYTEESIIEPEEEIDLALRYIETYDNSKLTRHIKRLQIKYSKHDFIVKIIMPLLTQIGSLWEKGKLKITNEHFATAHIEHILYSLIEIHENESLPKIVVGTPKDQKHELMALAVAAIISTQGYRVIYIGSSVPAQEIISVAEISNSLAIILSIIYPYDDYDLIDELKLIDEMTDDKLLIAGGSASMNYLNKFDHKHFLNVNDVDEMISLLNIYRKEKFLKL